MTNSPKIDLSSIMKGKNIINASSEKNEDIEEDIEQNNEKI